MTYEQIRQDEAIKTYIRQADASLIDNALVLFLHTDRDEDSNEADQCDACADI